MLHRAAKYCTNILQNHAVIDKKDSVIYVYGFELFWSTVLGVGSILIIGTVFNYLRLAVLFLLYFVPIRIVAGGYHAKTYGGCFLCSNVIGSLSVIFSGVMWNTENVEPILWMMFAVLYCYIWMHVLIELKKVRIVRDQSYKNMQYARRILVGELALLLIVRFFYNDIWGTYTAIIATCIAAATMFLERMGGERS